ncbi:type II toxin-antitoxin system RelE/ParE family toxin [Caldimonas brevitalea]|uniref:type II toxin-antitoxin system RelE/ParE family toxin n=1 Tax=Caldimonas brevitalea TaxID=413882 RepID=UPI001EEE9C4E|nr:type II toxin-antitoxin system RelE/ParE family toxin [Caldimonas brevitalea]
MERNPLAARDVYDEIVKQSDLLLQHPEIGRPGRVSGTRELVISGFPYVIPYAIRDNESIVLLRVFCTQRGNGLQKASAEGCSL